jgi:hypothetical protein
MTKSSSGDLANLKEAKLTRRDWILLPALSLLTMLVLSFVPQELGRKLFQGQAGNMSQCIVKGNPETKARAIPNSACQFETLVNSHSAPGAKSNFTMRLSPAQQAIHDRSPIALARC